MGEGDRSAADLATEYLAGLSAHDADRVADLVAVDFVNEHTGVMGEGCVGREVYRERLAGFFSQLADLNYQLESLIVDGGRVAAPYVLTATIDGTPIRVRGVMIIETANGYITRRTDYWDGLTVTQQLGG